MIAEQSAGHHEFIPKNPRTTIDLRVYVNRDRCNAWSQIADFKSGSTWPIEFKAGYIEHVRTLEISPTDKITVQLIATSTGSFQRQEFCHRHFFSTVVSADELVALRKDDRSLEILDRCCLSKAEEADMIDGPAPLKEPKTNLIEMKDK